MRSSVALLRPSDNPLIRLSQLVQIEVDVDEGAPVAGCFPPFFFSFLPARSVDAGKEVEAGAFSFPPFFLPFLPFFELGSQAVLYVFIQQSVGYFVL